MKPNIKIKIIIYEIDDSSNYIWPKKKVITQPKIKYTIMSLDIHYIFLYEV